MDVVRRRDVYRYRYEHAPNHTAYMVYANPATDRGKWLFQMLQKEGQRTALHHVAAGYFYVYTELDPHHFDYTHTMDSGYQVHLRCAIMPANVKPDTSVWNYLLRGTE